MKTTVDCFTGLLPAAPTCRTTGWTVGRPSGVIFYVEETSRAFITVWRKQTNRLRQPETVPGAASLLAPEWHTVFPGGLQLST